MKFRFLYYIATGVIGIGIGVGIAIWGGWGSQSGIKEVEGVVSKISANSDSLCIAQHPADQTVLCEAVGMAPSKIPKVGTRVRAGWAMIPRDAAGHLAGTFLYAFPTG